MDKEVCCVNTKAIIDYIQEHSPDDLEMLTEGLDPEINGLGEPMAFLTDVNNWTSSTVFRKMMQQARHIMQDDDIAFKVGFDSIKKRRLGDMQKTLRILGPKKALKRLQAINAKFNRTKVVKVLHAEAAQVTVRLHWFPGLDITKDFCRFDQGIYAALPTVWQSPPAQLVETMCFFDGAPYCEYQLKWSRFSRFRNIGDLLLSGRSILESMLEGMEDDKTLIQKKYAEVHHLNAQLQKKVQQLVSLRDASRAVASILETDQLLENVMTLLVNILRFDRVILMLIDRERGCLTHTHTAGTPQEFMDQISRYEVPLHRMSNILARVASTGNVALIRDMERDGLNQDDFILSLVHPRSFVVVPLISRNKIIGVLGAGKTGDEEVTEDDKDCLVDFSNGIAAAIENAQLYGHLNTSYLSTVQALAKALEAKDTYTQGHSSRVAEYSVCIAQNMGLSEKEIDQIRQASLLHDIGKIGIKEYLLHKPDALTENEREEFEQHPIIGEEILKPLGFLGGQMAIIRNHHEWYNGDGYPDQLSGDRIPLEVRIVTVADAYDAMISDRAYRSALTQEQAIRQIAEYTNIQFDPFVASAFLKTMS